MSAAAVPTVALMFERGAFDRTDTLGVSQILPIVVAGQAVFTIIASTMTRTFYVTKDTHTVPIIGAVSSLFYFLIGSLIVDSWGYVGLVSIQAILIGSTVVTMYVMILLKIKAFRSIQNQLFKDAARYILAAVITFVSAWIVSEAVSSFAVLIQFFTISLISGLIYMALLFRIDDTMALAILDMAGISMMSEKLGLQRFIKVLRVSG
jgi:peptidoglycan biosynthesis protein MviN/MurJ (putative lipid II flippase)